jgi:predicted nucleotidyltransferase
MFKKKKKARPATTVSGYCNFMTEEYRKLLLSKEYEFLQKDEHLGKNIVLLTIGGSRAYGTNTPTSDYDIRGITVEDLDTILGLNNFEQFTNSATDTTIYGFNRYIKLFGDCNPNIIEIAGTNKFLYISPLGKKIIENIDLFITRRVADKFAGYAAAQLAKIRNAMYGDLLSEEEKKQQECNAINNAMKSFDEHYKHYVSLRKSFFRKNTHPINVYQKGDRLFTDVNINNCPLEEFKGMVKEIKNVCDDYDKIGNRNTKIDDAHMCKHMMHLVRLYHMGIEILNGEGINVYREKDHDELMDIRNGKYMKDHLGTPEFFEMVDKLKLEFKEAESKTKLPQRINKDAINKFLIECNKEIILGEDNSYTFLDFIEDLRNNKINITE